MSGDIAAAGEMMMGALAARAMEPGAGEASGCGPAGALCLNCGTGLIGAHCHRCGQPAHVHRSVGAIGHELAHGVFHFEGKAFRTLPMLLFRPGELTRRYVAGERARFVSPLALFLFTVFLMFAVVANLPGAGLGDLDKAFDGADFDRTRAEFARERERTKADIKEKMERIADERNDDAPEQALIARYERDLQELRANDARLAQAQRFLPPPDAKTAAEPDASETWLEKKWRYAKENPKLLIYKVKTSAYKYSWALIPISLPFIWLLFPFRRDVGMYDHAVFATYSLSFMSLLVVAITVAEAASAPEGLVALAAFVAPPLHIYRQLKGAYRLGRVGALWRTTWMLFFSTITTSFFVLFLLVMGASG